jgi:hypothetical protein
MGSPFPSAVHRADDPYLRERSATAGHLCPQFFGEHPESRDRAVERSVEYDGTSCEKRFSTAPTANRPPVPP